MSNSPRPIPYGGEEGKDTKKREYAANRNIRSFPPMLTSRCKALLENMLGPELAVRLPEANVDPAIPQVNLKWDTVDARTGEVM